jgi:hypothetical protein
MMRFMAQSASRGLLQQLIARDTLARLVDDVGSTGARILPLKGVLLVALGLRTAAERPMIDVDVLVEPHLAREIVAAARSRGWQVPSGTDWACVLIHPKTSSTSIDLHRTLFPPHHYAMDTHAVFARAQPDRKLFGREITLMHRLDLYAHLVGHFVKSRSDRRDLRHLHDFAAVGRWCGVPPQECAEHLVRLGLARAAFYALRLAMEVEPDAFTRDVLHALPRDRRGRALARAADAVLSRTGSGSYWGIPFIHSLNSTLPRAARSLAAHVMDSKETGLRAPDDWWQS